MNVENSYQREIDALRAIAVISVIVFHFSDGAILPHGYLGVDIFFVISGYVITKVSFASYAFYSFGNVIEFWARRAQRILPAMLAMILLFSVVIVFVASWKYSSLAIKSGIAAALGSSNWYFLSRATDYWGEEASLNVFTHTWSLSVEAQYYFVWPLLLWLLMQLSSRFSRLPLNVFVKVSLLVIFIASLSHYLLNQPLDKESTFYGTHFRIWELLSGSLIYLCSRSSNKGWLFRSPRCVYTFSFVKAGGFTDLLSSLCLVVTICIILGLLDLEKRSLLLLVVLLTCGLILSVRTSRLTYRVLSLNMMVGIGKISYSLYLFHWPVNVIFNWIDYPPLLGVILKVAITLFLAVLSYAYLENRFRKRNFGLSASRLIFAYTSSIVLSCFVMGSWGIYTKRSQSERPNPVMIHNNYPCHSPHWSATTVKQCLGYTATHERMIYVIGDSHSTNLLPSIEANLLKGDSLRYWGSAELQASMLLEKNSAFQNMLDLLNAQLKGGDLVIYTISRDNLFDEDFSQEGSRSAVRERVVKLEARLTELARSVVSQGGSIYFIDGLPKVCSHKRFDLRKQRNPNNPCEGSRQRSLDDRAPLSDIYRAVSESTGARIKDPHPYLCPNDICESQINGRLLYFDGSPHFITDYPDPLRQFFSDHVFK